MKSKYLFFVFVFIFSCTDDKKNMLSGLWVIHKVYSNGKNITATNFYTNGMVFSLNKGCSMPSDTSLILQEYCKWQVIRFNEKDFLKIDTNTKFFNDTFEIVTLDNNVLILESKIKRIECTKSF